jgi:pyridoxine 5'-phosphate synthase PdxJ
MAANIYHALIKSGLLFMILLVWMAAPGYANGQMLYKYIDEEGTYVITDNPPPDYTLVPDSPPDVTEEKRLELDRDKEKEGEKTQTIRNAGTERQEKIGAARRDWEQAVTREENYRLNMQTAANYSQRLYWREMWERQKKVVEETKKKLDELMGLR